MNCTKRITVTGYKVAYVDLRQPKPREIQEEPYILDKDAIDALGLLGLSVTGFINAKYSMAGFHVVSVSRIAGKRITSVDLRHLWATAEIETGKEIPQE